MRELDVGALPVCDHQATVGDAMSPGIVWIYADEEVEKAAHVMEEKQLRRLPVISRVKRLVGIVSLGDLVVESQPAFSGVALKAISEPV